MTTAHPLAIDEGLLPGSLSEIRTIIGLQATLRLVESFGGTRLFVPKVPKPHHRLLHQMGAELARQLSGRFGGETISVPRADRIVRRMRNQTIIAAYDSGAPVRELALRYHLTERQIYAILAEAT